MDMDQRSRVYQAQQKSSSPALELPMIVRGLERNFSAGQSKRLPSSHEFYELSHVVSGSLSFRIGGKKVELHSGQTLIIPPMMEHTYEIPDEQGVEIISIYFHFVPMEQLYSVEASRPHPRVHSDSFKEFMEYLTDDESSMTERAEFFLLRGKWRREIADVAERILVADSDEGYGNDLLIQSMGTELLVYAVRALKEEWEESLKLRTGKAKELVYVARDFIYDNYDRNINVSDVADYVFLSQGYFARAFREEMGISPMSFLLKVRVDNACTLLAEEDSKISSIALRVGFTSPQRFNAAFRKQMKMTPMEYRQKVREEQEKSGADG